MPVRIHRESRDPGLGNKTYSGLHSGLHSLRTSVPSELRPRNASQFSIVRVCIHILTFICYIKVSVEGRNLIMFCMNYIDCVLHGVIDLFVFYCFVDVGLCVVWV